MRISDWSSDVCSSDLYATYSANRFDASISHATFGPNLSDVADLNVTTARVGTSLAFADGSFGIGRRINDSFMLLSPHKNLGKRSVVAGQSLAENNYISKSGALEIGRASWREGVCLYV